MSLYHEAAPFLDTTSDQSGSLQFRIFKSEHLKSKPSQVFALVIEATKWSEILSEVIQNTGLLRQERKVQRTYIQPRR